MDGFTKQNRILKTPLQKRNLQHIHGSSGQRRASAARLALPAGALRLYHRGERETQVRIDASFFRVRRLAAALAVSEKPL